MYGTFVVNSPTPTTAEVEKQSATVNAGSPKTLTFYWDASSYRKGNYTITATADTLPEEIDPTDNTLVDGWIFARALQQETAARRFSQLNAEALSFFQIHMCKGPSASRNNMEGHASTTPRVRLGLETIFQE